MPFDETVQGALGHDRALRAEGGAQRLIARADAAPQRTDSVVQLLIPLAARNLSAAQNELVDRLERSDPEAQWSCFTLASCLDGCRRGEGRLDLSLGSSPCDRLHPEGLSLSCGDDFVDLEPRDTE